MTTLNDVTLTQVAVLDSTMAYREAGNPDSPTVLFLHGSRTSSYVWRNIIPLVAPVAHCIAPDLIGFGQSGKADVEYRFFDHVRYLDAFLDKANISSAYVVAHDWGTALAFLLAARRPEFVRALAFMEFIHPMPTWDDFHADAPERFKKFRTQGVGERRSRPPKWRRFPNDPPIAGEAADVYSAIEGAHRALGQSSYPKLLFAGDPDAAALVSPAFAESFASGLKNCTVVDLGPGNHSLPEDHPEAIGSAVHEWLIKLGVTAGS